MTIYLPPSLGHVCLQECKQRRLHFIEPVENAQVLYNCEVKHTDGVLVVGHSSHSLRTSLFYMMRMRLSSGVVLLRRCSWYKRGYKCTFVLQLVSATLPRH